MTQDDLVERLGGKRYPSDISEYEHGKRRLAVVDLPDFARALDVPITYFFEEVLPEDELETALLEWFRMLPSERAKRRVFTYMQQTAHLIIGGEPESSAPSSAHPHERDEHRLRKKSK